MKRFFIIGFVFLFVLFLSAPTFAQCVSLTTLGSAATQNFDTLSNTAGSTTNNLTITGWFLTESGSGARDNEQYAVDTGASTTGDMYSYGAAGSTERALGQLRSGTLIPLFGACYTNNTGSTITSLAIAYTGEEWRLGTAGRTDQMNFEYSLNATDLTTGTWTNVAALNFVTPDTVTVGAKNGNAAASRTALSSTISSLSIANGATFWIRWNDTDASGADDGLAIDDFSLTPQFTAPVNLSVNDVSLNEGNAGTTSYTFTVSLSAPAGPGGVTFDIATADGTAAQPGDYTQKSLTGQTIPAGSSTYSFTVLVNGDTTPETNETFFVNVTNVTGATVVDGQGQGTIVNDDVAPSLSVSNVSLNEGNTGTTNFNFTVSLSAPAPVGGVTFDIATADGTAAQPGDYTQKSLTAQTIPAGSSSYSFTVLVNGDTTVEADETFFVNVSNVTNATVNDGQGQGTIFNDDVAVATVEFSDSTYTEDESQIAYITILRSGDLSGTTTVNYSTQTPGLSRGVVQTATGGADCTPGVDFINQSGTLTFDVGEDFKEIQIQLCSDTFTEPNEAFNVYLSNVSGGTLGEIQTAQVIINDTANEFSNPNPIYIGSAPDTYSSSIQVSGVPRNIGGLRVTLFDFGHLAADDLDVLLVGPQGQKFLLMADAGGANGLDEPVTVTFSDNAGQVLPDNSQIFAGIYEPTTWIPGQPSFPAPAPPAPYIEPGNTVGGAITLASTFGNTNANGTWTLYIRDDNGTAALIGLDGAVFGGWGIQFLSPTAADVSVGGSVRAGKTPVAGATVMLTGGNLTEPRIAKTNSFGNYRFEGLPVGETYIVTIVSNRYYFPQSSIILNVSESVDGADFEAEDR